MNIKSNIYIFHGSKAKFASAAFSSLDLAKAWIAQHGLSGLLTAYPLDQGVYDWALAQGYFKPKSQAQSQASFIQHFSSAHMEHYHFENGVLC